MACVNPDGSLSESATKLLAALAVPMTPEEISKAIGQPLFRVRSSLREMSEAGLVAASGEKYSATEAGKSRV